MYRESLTDILTRFAEVPGLSQAKVAVMGDLPPWTEPAIVLLLRLVQTGKSSEAKLDFPV